MVVVVGVVVVVVVVVFGDLLYLQDASQTYLEATKISSRSCAENISSCHLWGLGGGGQLLSPSPALHAESSLPFSLQTASLA